jgi:hypothetical protein
MSAIAAPPTFTLRTILPGASRETGTIKFATQFEALDAVSYAGSIGFEDVAATTTKAALTWRNRFPSRREQSLRWGTHRIT